MKETFFVFLDLDNTLMDFDKAERLSLSETLRSFGVEPEEAILRRYHEINIRHWELLEDGVLSREQILLRRFTTLFEELGLSCDGAAVNLDYEGRLSRACWMIPGARELLESLYGRYPLYIVSNGSAEVQDGRLAGADLARYFDGVFISERVGFDKPAREFFETCFAAVPGFDRRRALIVGDSLSSDIRGGQLAGVKTCWYNPKKKPGRKEIRPDYEISELSQLPPLLEELSAL